MNNFSSELEQKFFSNANEYLKRNDLNDLYFSHDSQFVGVRYSYKPDGLLVERSSSRVIALFEVKKFQVEVDLLIDELLLEAAKSFNSDFFILTNGKDSIAINFLKNERKLLDSIDGLFSYIISSGQENVDPKSFREEIISAYEQGLKNSDLPRTRKEALVRLLNRSKWNLILSHDTIEIQDNFGPDSFQRKLINLLLPRLQDTSICRYCSLDSIFSTINYGTIRMNGIIGMNDKSEVDYTDRLIYEENKAFFSKPKGIVKEINKKYIISCSTIENLDDLTMYRLYSENNRGVCLGIDLEKQNIKANMLLGKVSYGKKDGSHPSLDFLKEFVKQVEKTVNKKLTFSNYNTWKHFFKGYEYAVEKEVRLLYIHDGLDGIQPVDNGWLLTNSDKIVNPYVAFTFNGGDFPLQIRKIILASNCPEWQTNKVQLEEMLDQKFLEWGSKGKMEPAPQLNPISIEASSLTSYRT